MGGDLAEKSSFTIVKCIAAECFLKWGRSCRKNQFYNSKTHRGRMFFEMGGDLAEKSSFSIVKRIAAECFSNWGAILQKKTVLQ